MNETAVNITNIATVNSIKPKLCNTINCTQDTSAYWVTAALITILIGIVVNCIRYRRRYFQSPEEYKSNDIKRITHMVERQLVTKNVVPCSSLCPCNDEHGTTFLVTSCLSTCIIECDTKCS